ncbi:MAG: tRNA (adenosine(37)-N6)-threonylcarbamoyltransferase complex dimerization subunit type 1 TsaB [Pseudomonadota bacterium]|nr:tRNA (adenosine(37)-N6)-threonylcarbamoyltransferase complex dimerization subunit type 1 TsaB [Pseudomonadota bacterium]
MKVLAIDASGESCSAALLLGSQLEQRLSREPRRHGELILAMMDDLLKQAGITLSVLDALAFGRGPGSFTGVRIATAVVQGAAFGADLPVVPVSTLAALAQGHFRTQGRVRSLPAFDARMGEVYWGCYVLGDTGLMQPVCEEQVAAPERVSVPADAGWHGIGSGWAAHGEALCRRMGPRLQSVSMDGICESRDIAVLAAAEVTAGRFVTAERALPVYLRDRVTAAR